MLKTARFWLTVSLAINLLLVGVVAGRLSALPLLPPLPMVIGQHLTEGLSSEARAQFMHMMRDSVTRHMTELEQHRDRLYEIVSADTLDPAAFHAARLAFEDQMATIKTEMGAQMERFIIGLTTADRQSLARKLRDLPPMP